MNDKAGFSCILSPSERHLLDVFLGLSRDGIIHIEMNYIFSSDIRLLAVEILSLIEA